MGIIKNAFGIRSKKEGKNIPEDILNKFEKAEELKGGKDGSTYYKESKPYAILWSIRDGAEDSRIGSAESESIVGELLPQSSRGQDIQIGAITDVGEDKQFIGRVEQDNTRNNTSRTNSRRVIRFVRRK